MHPLKFTRSLKKGSVNVHNTECGTTRDQTIGKPKADKTPEVSHSPVKFILSFLQPCSLASAAATNNKAWTSKTNFNPKSSGGTQLPGSLGRVQPSLEVQKPSRGGQELCQPLNVHKSKI